MSRTRVVNGVTLPAPGEEGSAEALAALRTLHALERVRVGHPASTVAAVTGQSMHTTQAVLMALRRRRRVHCVGAGLGATWRLGPGHDHTDDGDKESSRAA